MSWTIRKPGQGYWTRLLSGLGAGVLVLFGSLWLWDVVGSYTNNVYIPAMVALAPVVIFGILVFRWTAAKDGTVDFLIETDDEMKQVNWPSRREVIGSTIVVIAAIFLLVALLFDADQMFADLFAAAGVLHFGGASIILSQLGWAQPTVWVLAAVGLAMLAFAVLRFIALKHVVINKLGIENPTTSGVVINTVLQTVVATWLAFHATVLIDGIRGLEQVRASEQIHRYVGLGGWILAAVATVLLAVAIDQVTLRHHDEGDAAGAGQRHRIGGRSGGGSVLKSPALPVELATNAVCVVAAWAVVQAIGAQFAS